MTELENSKYNKIQNSNCDKNTKTQIVTKLEI